MRLSGFDYSSESTYFVTNCAYERAHLFGAVRDDAMRRSPAGDLVQAAWERTLVLRREVVPHAFIVMPNHFHALFTLDPEAISDISPSSDVVVDGSADALQCVPTDVTPVARRAPHSVATIMGGMKGDATRQIRRLFNAPEMEVWQERYHDHIVRGEQEFETILNYIETNPENWHKDRYATE